MAFGSAGLRISALFPLACATVAFVLTMLLLFAGKQQGFMEDYHILMLNSSGLGENLIPTPAIGGNKPSTTVSGGGIGGFFSGIVSSATAAIGDGIGALESDVASFENEVADMLAKKLGIHEFYSLHLMDGCDGYFTPNATSPDPGFNVTNCTGPLPKELFNITSLLDHELSVGPVHLNFATLGITQDLQDGLNAIPAVLVLLALPYLLGAGFSGLSMLLSFLGLFRPGPGGSRIRERDLEKSSGVGARHVGWKRNFFLTLTNFFVAFCGALTLGVGSGIASVKMEDIASEINKYGNKFGLYAITSAPFKRMTWAAFALMAAAMLYWAVQTVFSCTRRRSGGTRPAGNSTRRRWRL